VRKAQLEDLLRQLSSLVGSGEVTMIGSQCVHAIVGDAPAEVLLSQECDLLFEGDDPTATLVDEELGPSSAYQRDTGVYVDVIRGTFPFLPDGWEQRTQTIDVGVLKARCLEVHDLVLSKLAAGRLKDNEMVAALITHRLVVLDIIRERISAVSDLHLRAILMARLQLVLENVE
jgi:hypothetical protein